MGRVALVTGAGRGIGAAIAAKLAESGHDIAINDLDTKAADEVASKVRSLGRRAIIVSQDVSQYSAAAEMVSQVRSAMGVLDVVVNNAGILRDALLIKMDEAKWDDVIRVNLKGVFNVGQAAARVMSEQKSGNIVNIASIAWLGNVGQTNYAAAKAGVVAMTSTWALELARFGIRVNAIAPGFIDTPLIQAVPSELREKFMGRVPLRRFGKPEEIGDLVSFLVSERAAYITGQCLHIDGGLAVGLGSM